MSQEKTNISTQSISIIDRLKQTVSNASPILPCNDADEVSNDCMLGDLLVEFKIVTEKLLEHALDSSYELGIPLGRVLIMSGWVTERQLQMVIQLQSLLKDGILSLQTGHRVNELMADDSVTLEEALKCVGCTSAMKSRTNRLGELLVMAGIVQSHEVDEAIARAQSLGLPFGRCLMLSGLISPALLETAINAQRLIRRKRMTKEGAVNALAAASQRLETDPSYFMAQCYQQAPVRTIRLGELLTLSGIVSESQVQYAVEMGLLHNLPLGHLLLDVGLISRRSLENALVLQKMVANGSLKPLEAVYALIDTHYYGYSVAQALSDNERSGEPTESVQFTEFLVSSGVASKRTIRESLESALKSPQMVGKALMLAGAIDENNLQIALRCHFYVREGMLSFEEGIVIYDHSVRMGLSVEEAVGQLGFELRQRKEAVEQVA